jgi:hypothetical protein
MLEINQSEHLKQGQSLGGIYCNSITFVSINVSFSAISRKGEGTKFGASEFRNSNVVQP